MGKQRKSKNAVNGELSNYDKQVAALAKEKRDNAIIIALSVFFAVVIIVGLIFALGGFDGLKWEKDQKFNATHYATIEIEGYGTVKLELYGEEAPKTVEAFVNLANSGYFDGLSFYGIQSKANGVDYLKGGNEVDNVDPIYGEFENNGYDNKILHKKGIISMASIEEKKSSPNKFFIIVSDSERNSYIDGAFAAFGKVTDGMSIIEQIHSNATPYDDDGTILPTSQPVITKITVDKSE